MDERRIRVAVGGVVAGVLVAMALHAPADAAVLCQRKGKIKIRPEACKPKETLVQDLGAQARTVTDLFEAVCAGSRTRSLVTAPPSFLYSGDDCEGACRSFDGDEAGCATAYQLTWGGPSACAYALGKCVPCIGCGEPAGICIDACRPVACADAARTRFTGGPGTRACDRLETQEECETGWAMQYGRRPTSCYWDGVGGRCRGCGGENEGNGNCTNVCRPADWCQDPGRTYVQYCGMHNGNEVACNGAFTDGGGLAARRPYTCYYDAGAGQCLACYTVEELQGRCVDTCASWEEGS